MSEWLAVFGWVLAAAVLSGAVCGATGLLVVGLRIPFAVVCCSHFALAGAVWAMRFDFSTGAGSLAGAAAGALLAGWLSGVKRVDSNAALGVVFSVSLGLVFLGMHGGSGPRVEALSLIWGNLLFAGRREVLLLAILAVLLLVFGRVFGHALKVLLFSRDLARYLVPEALLFTLVLVFVTVVIAFNLELIGGLMLFSLICNPAAAALMIGRSVGSALGWSIAFGVGGALGGFALAWALGWPAGASIALVSAAPFLVVGLKRKVAA